MSQNIWGDSETQFFYELTPDSIIDAVESLGYRCTGRCLTLNSMENRVYEIQIEVDESKIISESERFVVAKFYRPGRWSKEQILDEHQFLFDLDEAEVPIIAPFKFDGESLFEFSQAKLWFCVFPKKGGRAPQEMNIEQLEIMGRQLGRLHAVGKSRVSNNRLNLSPDIFVKQNSDYLIENQKIPFYLEGRYQELVNEIYNVSAPLFQNIGTQRIHGDCHWGNVILRDGEGMFFIDFDDMLTGPCVQDLWLINPIGGDEGKRQFNTMLEAYESMKHFDDRELRLIEALRAYRYIHFSAWIAKRWGDTAFQMAFEHYREDSYWETQIRDLEDQLRLIR